MMRKVNIIFDTFKHLWKVDKFDEYGNQVGYWVGHSYQDAQKAAQDWKYPTTYTITSATEFKR